MKWFFKLINFFLTTLDADLDTASTGTITVKDKIVDGYTLVDWEYNFFIVVDLPNKWARELFRIWKVEWKVLHYDKRISPAWVYNHEKWVLVQINDVSELLNYFSKNVDVFWFAEETTWLDVKVQWGDVEYNWTRVSVATTIVTCSDDSTVTLWLDFLDWTIKEVADLPNFIGYQLCEVTTVAWEVTNIVEKRSVNLTNVFDATYFNMVNGKWTFKTNTIWTDHIKDNSITAVKLQNGIVGESKIADDSITAAKLKNKIIDTDQIVDTILVKINKTDLLVTWGSSTEFLAKDGTYHPLSVLGVLVDETWVQEWDYLVRRWEIWKPERKQVETTFDNIFYKDWSVQYVSNLKKWTIEHLIYDEEETTYWQVNIKTFEDNMDFSSNVIQIADVDGTETWINWVDDTSNYIYKQSRKLSLWADATGTITLDKHLVLSFSNGLLSFFCYVSDINNADFAKVQYRTDASNYFEYDYLPLLTTGWNYIEVNINDFTVVWTPNWFNIDFIRFEFSTNISWACDFNIDLLREKYANISNDVYTEEWLYTVLNDPSDNTDYLALFWEFWRNNATPWKFKLTTLNQWRKYFNFKYTSTFSWYKKSELNIYFRTDVRIILLSDDTLRIREWWTDRVVTPFTWNEWQDYEFQAILNWDTITIYIDWLEVSTYSWLLLTEEWEVKIHEWYNGISFHKWFNIEIIKETDTHAIWWNPIRINQSIWFGDQLEFQKSSYKCVASWSNFLGWDVASEYAGITNDYCKQFTINTNQTITYAVWWKDLTTYNHFINVASNDLFKHVVDLDANVTKLTFKYKTDDSNYYSTEFTSFTAWLNILTSQFDTLIVTGNPDYTNIQSIDIDIEVSASSEVKIEMLEIISVTPPASEIYTQTWDILYFENEEFNNLVFMWDGKLVSNLSSDFIIDSWEFVSKVKWDWYFILRDNWTQDGYAIKKTGSEISFWKIESWTFTQLWDSAIINDVDWIVTLKVICKSDVFKYYYSEDWLTYNLIDEVTDSTFSSWIISIVGTLGFRVYDILYINDQSVNDIRTMLMYEWWTLVWSISRP